MSDWSEFVGGGVQNAAARERRASAALRSSQHKQPNASDSVARAARARLSFSDDEQSPEETQISPTFSDTAAKP